MRMMRGSADSIDLPASSVHCVVTSPPYWGKRVYGDNPAEELGLEDLTGYLRRLTVMMREVRRVMRPDALAWLNIGDTAAGSGGAGGDHNGGGLKSEYRYRQGKPITQLPVEHGAGGMVPEWVVARMKLETGNWCGVPGLVAQHLQGDGWFVRSTIVWDKGQDSAEDLRHIRRPRVSHETILMLAPSMDYRFFPDALEDETGSVWHFPPGSSVGDSHYAPFPDELPRRCIAVSTEPGDVVFDPFAGSGTTVRVADSMGRIGIGLDLYAEDTRADH